VRNGKPRPPNAARVYDINERIQGAYVENIWNGLSHLELTSGLRIERSHTRTEDFFGQRDKKDATFALPSLNLTYALRPDTDLRAGLARSLRRPDLRSLSPVLESRDGTVADPDRQGNPKQRPESVWGLDVGLYHYFADQRGQLALNAFSRRFGDKIEPALRIEDERFISRPENVARAWAHGLEASTRLPLETWGISGTTLWGNAVYTHARIKDNGGSRRFADQPDAAFNLGVDYFAPSLRSTFGMAVNHTVAIDQSQPLPEGKQLHCEIDSRTRLDLSMRTDIGRNATFTLSLTNLLGQTEKRTDRLLDAHGHTASLSRTTEPTYRAVFARLNWTF